MRHHDAVPFPLSVRTDDDVVAPTLSDPVARSASAAVGGPLGRYARTGRSWWTPLRLVLAVATVMFGLGIVQKAPCVTEDWGDAATPFSFSHLCYSDIQYLYAGRGLAEGIFPYTPVDHLPEVKQPATIEEEHSLTVEYPVLTGLWMGVAGIITHALGKSPDVSGIPHSAVSGDLDVQHDSAIFWGVNAVAFLLCLLVALGLLVRAQPRRPWDAMLIAAAPVLALTAMINWDLLAIAFVGAMLWAWATGRPVLTGVFIGLGAATKLYPLFFLGPLLVLCLRERRMATWMQTFAAALVAWLVTNLPIYLYSPDAYLWFWEFNSQRGPDFGSIWLVASNYGHVASSDLINATTWIFFGLSCVAIGLLGLLAPRRPRVVQLMFLVVVAFLLVNKVYSPQYVLWLLPFAALARPRWRDMLIWQACEVFYFFAIWMHIANFFVTAGAQDWAYALAVLVRIAGQLFLVVLVVRDILFPWHDPVRSDGLSDDPLGGILDVGIDAEVHAAAAPAKFGEVCGRRPEVGRSEALGGGRVS
jgi:uncharacterized membrane protein